MNTCIRTAATLVLAAFAGAALPAQSLDPAAILQPKPDTWPTYSGDYSGRRYSPLTEINTSNVHGLTLAWSQKLSSATAPPVAAGPFAQAAASTKVIMGGVGDIQAPMGQIKGAEIMVDGTLY